MNEFDVRFQCLEAASFDRVRAKELADFVIYGNTGDVKKTIKTPPVKGKAYAKK